MPKMILTPPAGLMLPERLALSDYIDASMPEGWRATWSLRFGIAGPHGAQAIDQSAWLYDGKPADLRNLDDWHLSMELQDIVYRRLRTDWDTTTGRDAARYLENLEHHRSEAKQLCASVRGLPSLCELPAVYNPPPRQSAIGHLSGLGWRYDAGRGWRHT